MNFETAKVVILTVPEMRIALVLRLIRSANVDFITFSVRILLGVVGKTERSQSAADMEHRPKKLESSQDVTP